MRPRYCPLEEIRFAAKTGFMSRDIWEQYFSKRSRARNVTVWQDFVRHKFFAPHASERLSNVLVLGLKGKKIIEEMGGEVVSPPNLNQISHDEIVSRIALDLMRSSHVSGLKTEGELKKQYMSWIKKTREGREAKMPDLLLELKSQSESKIALEIELSRKSPERYRKVMNSYASQTTAKKIVFISDQESIFDRISRAMKSTGYPSWEKPVGYSRLKEWQMNPLSAVIYFPGQSTSLEKMASEGCSRVA